MHSYCSYSDVNYFSRFCVLLDSIRKYDSESIVFLLCLDSETFELAQDLAPKQVTLLNLEEIEGRYPELLDAKAGRTKMEYVFTLTPFLLRWVQEKTNDNDLAIYLDADLFFYESPESVIEELGPSEIGIIPHSYPSNIAQSLRKYGLYNVGWVGFRNSQAGRQCLDWWASQCLEWCGDEPLNGKYADQGYLDQFPNLFEGVKVLENREFNLAPWNTRGQVILTDSDGRVTLGDHTPLTFFHFHGLKRFGKWMVTSQLNYRSPASKSLVEHVYKPYLQALQTTERELERTKSVRPMQKLVRGKGARKWVRNLLGKALMIASVLTGNAVDMSRLK